MFQYAFAKAIAVKYVVALDNSGFETDLFISEEIIDC
jgi:hypothetical protein